MNAVDINNDGVINWSEFLAATLDKKIQLNKEKLKSVFCHFDVDKSGFITQNNLQLLMAKCGKTMINEEITIMLDECDINKDSKIGFDEFCKIMECNTKTELRVETENFENIKYNKQK